MKQICSALAGFTLLFTTHYAQAQCTVAISPSTNDTVCAGTSTTLTANSFGPSTMVTTTFAAGNNHRGNMFDITALNTVTITAFDAHPMGNTTIEIYYKTGTWNGFANNPGAWTLIGSAAVTAQPTGNPTTVPIAINVTIPAGQTYGFYVTSNNTGVSLNYSNGTSVGNVYSSDANIQFLEGGGLEYPFTNGTGSVNTPRVWNGRIHYSVPGTTTYLWSTLATTQAITETVNATTQYVVEATISGCGSPVYDTINMVVSTPAVSAGSDTFACMFSTHTFYGSGAASYTWDNGVTDGVPFTATTSGNYIVTGTDLYGCMDSDTVFFLAVPPPVINAGNDTSVCAGQSLTLSGSGMGVTYTWNNGITDGVPFTPATTLMYTVVGIDSYGCTNLDSALVTVNSLPVVMAGPDTTVCNESMLTLNGTGAVFYNWSNGITDGVPFQVTGTMTYTVTGTDIYGCNASDDVMVSVHMVNTAITVVNETITASDSTATYQWIDCSTMSPIAGATNQSYTATVNGSYAVIVTDSMCSDTSACQAIFSTGMAASVNANGISVYPNPTEGNFTLSSGSVADRIEITDVTGRVVMSLIPQQAVVILSLNDQPAGVYFVQVMSTDKKTETIKVVKQ